MFLRLVADLLFGLGVFLGAAFGLGAAAFLGAATVAAVAAFFLLERLCVINFTARNRLLHPTLTHILVCIISLYTRCIIRSNIGASCVLAPKHLGYAGIGQL